MRAERLLLETDDKGLLKKIPKLPSNKRIEAIFLIIEENKEEFPITKRKPHPKIMGKLLIQGDTFTSASTEQWNLIW